MAAQKRVALHARASTLAKRQDPETQLLPLREYSARRGFGRAGLEPWARESWDGAGEGAGEARVPCGPCRGAPSTDCGARCGRPLDSSDWEATWAWVGDRVEVPPTRQIRLGWSGDDVA